MLLHRTGVGFSSAARRSDGITDRAVLHFEITDTLDQDPTGLEAFHPVTMHVTLLLVVLSLTLALGTRIALRYLGARLGDDATTPAEKIDTARSVWQSGLRLAAASAPVAGATTVVGAGIAAGWGWGPALLWICLGSIGIATLYTAGIPWLSREFPDAGFRDIVAAMLGPLAPHCAVVILLTALFALGPVITLGAAELLASWPRAATALLSLVLLLWFVRLQSRLTGLVVVALGVPLIALLADSWPVRFSGYVSVSLGSLDLTVQSRAWWIVAFVLLALWHSRREGTNRCLDTVAGVLLIILTGAVCAALVFTNPVLAAPVVISQDNYGPVPGLLGVTLTGGAIAMFHAFSESETPTVSGAADPATNGRIIIDALLAASVVLVIATAVPGTDQWLTVFGGITADRPLPLWLSGFVIMSAERLAMLGIPESAAAATLALTLGLVALSALVKILHIVVYLLAEATAKPARWHAPIGALVIIAGALVLRDVPAGLALWPMAGAACQVFVGILLACTGLALLDSRPLAIAFLVAAGVMLLIGATGSALALARGIWTHYAVIGAGHTICLAAACWTALILPGAIRRRGGALPHKDSLGTVTY